MNASSTTDPRSGLIERLVGWLPRGTSPVAAGIVVNGVATYVFLVVPARSGRLEPSTYAIFSALWFAAYLIGPGLYIPLEQELARLTSRARATARSADGEARAALWVVVISAAVFAVAILSAVGPIARGFFDGNRLVVVILAASIVSSGAAQWAKGWLGGSHQFGRYAVLVGGEGIIRAVSVTVLALVGVRSASAYALPVAVAPILAAIMVLSTSRPALGSAPREPARPIASAIGTLAVAQLGAQFLMNGVPLSLALLATSEENDVVGRLGAALVLARVPLFLFQAVQASLLPGLATMAAAGDWAGFNRRVRVVGVGMAGLGGLAVVVGAALGPFATRLFFGPDFVATAAEFGALSLSAVVIVLALVAGQALIALDRHRLVAVGWVAGAVGFVAVSALGSDLEWRALTAGIVGPVIAAVVLIGFLVRAERDRSGTGGLPVTALGDRYRPDR